MNANETVSPTPADSAGHEPDVVNAPLVMWSGALVVLLVVLALSLTTGLIAAFGDSGRSAADVPATPPPEATASSTAPQVTQDQPRQLSELRQSEEKLLGEYRWIDEASGVARIPIDRAMDILAERGLPVGEPREGTSSGATDVDAPTDNDDPGARDRIDDQNE